MIFETIGVIAGICIAVPAIPQILKTRKSKNAKGLSRSMFILLGTGNLCYWLYGWYLGSISMLIFNAISVVCSVLMLILIHKYQKN